ncbi:hypothetical protein OGV25_19360 [Pseudomonas sp. P1B16]|uniref:hypothetical protein n=1 Tax=Pseudomonas sp. P1B16 TaxID=2986074 RepID=UPI002A24275F|nr:hypothetical protein [Pseudomonas sp. P1B16]WPM29274.1 hypothetical protein OGV25_19360 [Pseudomonas sp. P1B16]
MQQVAFHQRLQFFECVEQVDAGLWRAHQQRQVAAGGVQGFDRKAQQFTHVPSPQARAAMAAKSDAAPSGRLTR